MARALDGWWEELGRPDPFVVVEGGAGTGALAAAVLGAAPACAPALRYVTVERSDVLRAEQRARLPLEEPAFVLGPSEPTAEDEEVRPRPGQGPLLTVLPELPALSVDGVVIANELLDNLAFRLLERAGDGWREVLVAAEAGRLVELLVPAAPQLAAEAEELAPEAVDGARIPLQHQARAWVASARELVQRGRVVVIDYADDTASLARRPWLDWVRTYRGHGRGDHPLDGPGAQDVTCEVANDQLPSPVSVRTQAEFLDAHGLAAFTDAARTAWEAGAARGDLASLRARSRVAEARALTDLAGLGGFSVIEWEPGRGRRRPARS